MTSPTDDEIADWKVYQNETYGYKLRYPEDWIVEEIKTEHPAEKDLMVEYITFNSPNKNYFLFFNLRKKETEIPLSPRTGVGAGDLAEGDTVKIGNVDIKTTNLVYNGKVKEVFYSSKGPGIFEINDFEGQAEFSYGDIGIDYENIDMTNLSELKTANKILSTFKFVK